MRRALSVLAVLAGLTWGGMVGWAVNVPETRAREQIRTAAFVVLIAAGTLTPAAGRRQSDPEGEAEETL